MALTPLHPGAVRARGSGRQICLDANDRLYPRSPGLGPKFKGTKQIPVIGNRDRFLPDTIYLIEEFIQPGGTVEHRVLSVNVQVDEILTRIRPDRKSTRLNSSHVATSYAAFCL